MTQRLAPGIHIAKAGAYVVSDLTPGEFGPVRAALRDRRTAPAAVAAPPSSSARIALTCQIAAGSIYYRSITGARDTTPADLENCLVPPEECVAMASAFAAEPLGPARGPT